MKPAALKRFLPRIMSPNMMLARTRPRRIAGAFFIHINQLCCFGGLLGLDQANKKTDKL